MKEKLKNFIYNFNLKPFLRNIILFESNPDFSDNTKAVFDELVNRGINQKYKLIWLVDDKEKFKDIKIKNVYFVNGKDSSKRGLKVKLIILFSKYIIDCNSYIYKLNKNQFRIHLTHGEFIKVARNYCEECGDLDYLVQTSAFFENIVSDTYKISKRKIAITGFPRNDVLFKENSVSNNLFKKNYKKFILWMPTYRNHINFKKFKSKPFLYGVPSINNEKEILELNKILKDNNILLGIKLHPVEDKTRLQKANLSNIVLINNEDLIDKHLTVMDILKDADALITDYSSVYYDYMLLNRPIGMAIEDIEQYKTYNELLFDSLEKNLPAEYIYNFEDLKKFFMNIVKNKDFFLKEREKAMKRFHKYIDGKSSARVADLIISHMKGSR